MIRNIALFGLAVLIMSADGSCNWEDIKKDCEDLLKPYKYYAFKVSRIEFGTESQFKEIQIPLFRGSEYRFVFNTAALPEDVKIQIWNAPAEFEGRKLIYEAEKGKDLVVYDPPKTKVNNRIFINYVIPASAKTEFGESSSGCVVFYSGFKH